MNLPVKTIQALLAAYAELGIEYAEALSRLLEHPDSVAEAERLHAILELAVTRLRGIASA